MAVTSETKKYVLLCGIPGTNLREAAESLGKRLGEQAAIVDVESLLEGPDGRQIRIQQLVSWPRDVVRECWQKAVGRACQELALKQGAPYRLMTCHLTLYNRVRSEFYSAIRPELFSSSDQKPFRVILLIDDILDTYLRLSEPGQVYDEALAVEEAARSTAPRLASTGSSFERVEIRAATCQQILSWRRAEIIQADLLAHQLERPFTILGVKHDERTLEALVNVQDSPLHSVYLSHPISSARRFERAVGEWPPLAGEVNAIPSALLASAGVIGVAPTAIDELRLRFDPDAPPGSVGTRWPSTFPGGAPAICQSMPDAETVNSLFRVDDDELGDCRDKVAGVMMSLQRAIEAEVPFRDHLLVELADHLLVYRPRPDGAPYSRGVASEIDHFSDMTALAPESTRRCALLYSDADLRAVLDRYVSTDSYGTAHLITVPTLWSHAHAYLSERLKQQSGGMNLDFLVEPVLRDDPLGGGFDATPISPTASAAFRRDALHLAGIKLFWQALTRRSSFDGRYRVFSFHDPSRNDSLRDVWTWMNSGAAYSLQEFITLVERHIGLPLHEWVESALDPLLNPDRSDG